MHSTYAVELFAELFGTLPNTRHPRAAAQPPASDIMVPNLPDPHGQVVYHVVPRRKDGRWNVKKEGATRPSAVCDTKDEAIEQARTFAKNLPWSKLVIHNRDGQISDEFNYGTPPENATQFEPTSQVGEWERQPADDTERDDVQDY
jgi:hypothetical protein